MSSEVLLFICMAVVFLGFSAGPLCLLFFHIKDAIANRGTEND